MYYVGPFILRNGAVVFGSYFPSYAPETGRIRNRLIIKVPRSFIFPAWNPRRSKRIDTEILEKLITYSIIVWWSSWTNHFPFNFFDPIQTKTVLIFQNEIDVLWCLYWSVLARNVNVVESKFQHREYADWTKLVHKQQGEKDYCDFFKAAPVELLGVYLGRTTRKPLEKLIKSHPEAIPRVLSYGQEAKLKSDFAITLL